MHVNRSVNFNKHLLGGQMKSVTTFHVLFAGLTRREPGKPFHTSQVPVDGRLVQSRVSNARFLVQVFYPVEFQKSEND